LKKFSQIAVLFAIIFFVGCSTKKNTVATRTYHSILAHYNIYFNGKESLKKGITRINEGYKDDYNQILHVFNYDDEALNSSASSDMDLTIKKASKVITLHSIKAKPQYKSNKLTPSEKEFVARNEYNSWVDDSYMLIVKANFYKRDFLETSKTITFILREFPKDPVRYEALIWQARIHCELNELNEADKILTNLQSDKKFPKRFKGELDATYAHFFIKKQQYKPASQKLEKALENVSGKQRKLRYTYILAQLYQLFDETDKAIEYFKKVVKMNPPYEMTFNARINLAGLLDANSKGNKSIKAQLYKMLKDQKNKEFQDQIYFTLANMEMREKNEVRAIDLYKKSAASTTNNEQQKATTFLTLADWYYSKKQYIPAQAYYDSCVQNLRPDYREIDRVKSRATNLNKLVTNLNTIHLQDSLLVLAAMSENDRMKIVERIIQDLRNREMMEQQKEQMASNIALNTLSNRNMNASTTQGAQGKWYFYNPVSVQQGLTEFQAKWGKRKLEDNWRRRNKGLNASSESAEIANPDKLEQEKKISDNKTPAYYLQDIPLTDSLKVASNQKIKEAHINAAGVYRNDLNETQEAIKLYEQLIARYPSSEFTPSAFYELYTAYMALGDNEKVQQYKQLILSKYPESIYAKVLTDPDYAKKLGEKGNEANRFYEETYTLYNNGNFAQVIQNADKAQQQFKDNVLFQKFLYLRVLSIGKTSDVTTFRRELEKFVTTYPKSEVAGPAKDMIAYIDNLNPDVKKAEQTLKAEATYNPQDNGSLLVAWVIDSNEDLNQLVFDVVNFNLDNFNKIKLQVQNAELTKEVKIITIHEFKDRKEALNYYTQFVQSPNIIKNLKNKKPVCFVITVENLSTLQADKNVETYQRFFDKYFLNKN